MKISVINSNTSWVLENIKRDFEKYTKHLIDNNNPDLKLYVNLFDFRNIYKKSIIQIHHYNILNSNEYNFDLYNQADACIVPNRITEDAVRPLLKIPIYRLSYWVLSNVTEKSNGLNSIRSQIGTNKKLIGSFVKDGNGKDGDTPKLSKGPDIFLDVVSKIKNIKVVLAGYARNYVIKELSKRNIPYVYMERFKDIGSLYECLDFYICTSRFEGGPQSILEASYKKTKILSTPVGMAEEVLHPDCICHNADEFVDKINGELDRVNYNYESSKRYLPELIIPQYDAILKLV